MGSSVLKKVPGSAKNSVKLSDQEFNQIREFIKQKTGISMSDSKRELIMSRLQKRIRALGLSSYGQYISLLKNGDKGELENFTNAVTTNLTSFFRENHHFEYLVDKILPELSRARAGTRKLRIWCSAASTGEEPYSIAMCMHEALPGISSWDAKMLATDIDSNVIATCRRGVYTDQRFEKVSNARKSKWFTPYDDGGKPSFVVSDKLKSLITFNKLNLMGQWPMKGKFDVIFCRNVLIYFDKPTQKKLVERFSGYLEDDGYLILGHSESLQNLTDAYKLVGKTIYRKNLQ